jgi:DNA-directed RNA polymerase subunit RPC12/RpoP
MADQAQWFDSLGSCGSCGKPATGRVMSLNNSRMGAYCAKCATKRIAKAKAERAKEERTDLQALKARAALRAGE